MPRGGRRPGAGRKPKSLQARVLPHPSMPPPTTNYPPAEVEEFDAPDALSKEERDVWLKQAPFAFRKGTLTRSTAFAFERYCKMVVQEENEAKSSAVNGANHRGLRREINVLELQFLLTPCGRLVQEPAQPGVSAQPQGKLARFRK